MVAAILHDVVEDTPATVQEVEAIFGEDVAKLVFGMSEPEVPAGTNRGERKEIYRQHLEKQCWRTKMIKFGDIYSNTKDIAMHDPDFAVVYLAEIQRTINSIDDNRIPLLLRQMVKEQVKLAKLYVDQFQANKKLVKKLSNIRTITETIKGELL
jgi:(p)ppGpp synthase/HD superfamily hydrolase